MDRSLKLKRYDVIHYIDNVGKFVNKIIITSPIMYNTQYLEANFGKIIKVERPVIYETIYEVKEILDKEEKEYLSSVIKPFKNKIRLIRKTSTLIGSKEYIVISVKDGSSLIFPSFKTGTMYKGMKIDKGYTLEELRL